MKIYEGTLYKGNRFPLWLVFKDSIIGNGGLSKLVKRLTNNMSTILDSVRSCMLMQPHRRIIFEIAPSSYLPFVVSLLLLLRVLFSFFFFNVLPQVCCRINCEVGVLDPPSRGRFVSNGRAFRSKATRARNTFLTSPRVSSSASKSWFWNGMS